MTLEHTDKTGLVSAQEWDSFVARQPQAHLLQTGQWGRLKSAFGWQAAHVVHGDSGAQVLFRTLPFGFSLAYIPKGPIGPDLLGLLPGLDALCRRRRAIALKVEPDAWSDEPGTSPPPGFRPARHSIQPPRTITIDLRGEEDLLLQRMKQKTRYNIRLAQRKGVVVREGGDLETFNRLMRTTGARDGFGVHSESYYRQVYELFNPHDMCALLIAEAESEPLAALMVFARGERAWYLYGASSDRQRNFMAPYALQWEAIRWARARGCLKYDLWGVPDEDADALEAGFTTRSDGLWGVYRFKRGFGGQVRRAAGPWDRVYNPLMVFFYDRWMRQP